MTWLFNKANRALHAAFDLEQRRDLSGLATVNRGRATFVIMRMHNYLEFAVAIQIQNRRYVIPVRRIEVLRVRMNFSSNHLCLHFPCNHPPQENDRIAALRELAGTSSSSAAR